MRAEGSQNQPHALRACSAAAPRCCNKGLHAQTFDWFDWFAGAVLWSIGAAKGKRKQSLQGHTELRPACGNERKGSKERGRGAKRERDQACATRATREREREGPGATSTLITFSSCAASVLMAVWFLRFQTCMGCLLVTKTCRCKAHCGPESQTLNPRVTRRCRR